MATTTERNHNAKHSMVLVSAFAKQTALNTEQTLDLKLYPTLSSLPKLDRRTEDNIDEMTGLEEASQVYDLGQFSSWNVEFDKMRPSDFAFIAAFGLGSCVSTNAGSTGKLHTIKPVSTLGNPAFTLAARYGKNIFWRRFAGMHVDSFSLDVQKDSWAKLSASCKGTGKSDTDFVREDVTAKRNATSLTVSSSVLSADLGNIHKIQVELSTGVWTDVVVSDVSSNVLTITAPDDTSSANVSYRALYRRAVAWNASIPDGSDESPLRVVDLAIVIGGKYSTGVFSGGYEIDADIKGFRYECNNNLRVEQVPGGTGEYANKAIRDGRIQTITLDREHLDALMEAAIDAGDEFALKATLQGALYEAGHYFTVQLIFPCVGLKEVAAAVDGKWLGESITFPVLEDGTNETTIALVKNQVATYAA